MDNRHEAYALLRYWFEELTPTQWFRQDDSVDAEIAKRFGHLIGPARAGHYNHWLDELTLGRALILILDQLPRNIFRNDALAFDSDGQAVDAARHLLAAFRPEIILLMPDERAFILMPFMHLEDLAAQQEGVALFASFDGHEEQHGFAVGHREAIRRFGRFPHRNDVLGRQTTPEEAAWLKEKPSGF